MSIPRRVFFRLFMKRFYNKQLANILVRTRESSSKELSMKIEALSALKNRVIRYGLTEQDDFIKEINVNISSVKSKLKKADIPLIRNRFDWEYEERRESKVGASDPAQLPAESRFKGPPSWLRPPW